MTRSALTLLLGGLAALAWSVDARAQSPASHYANNHVEANLHVGAFFPDEALFGADDTDAMVGGRLVYNLPSGWGFGGNFDWVLADSDLDGNDIDTNLYLYSAEIDYTFPSTSRIHFFLGAGVGAATLSYEDSPESLDGETNLLIPVAGGLKWFNATNRPSWALRAEVRDNIIFADDADEDSEATNNFELSGGISFFFGGR
ncbi:hypothetical protein BH18GEM1_BH18GEM1_19830 [soil metagenome]